MRGGGKILPWIGTTIGVLFISHIIGTAYIPYFASAKINCFILGFALRRLQNKRKQSILGVYIILILLMVMTNGIQIIHTYFSPLPLPRLLLYYWSTFCDYAHTLLGISFFIAFYTIFNRHKFADGILRVLQITDDYSYDVYLVHQFWILSPATLMKITPLLAINILLILIVTAISAFVVRRTAIFLLKFCVSDFAEKAKQFGMKILKSLHRK